MLHQVLLRILIVVGFVEDAGDAAPLNLDAVPQALQERALIEGAVASDRTGRAMIEEGYPTELLQFQSQRAILAPADIGTYLHLTGIVGTEGKSHAADVQFWTLEMLYPKEGVTNQFKKEQA